MEGFLNCKFQNSVSPFLGICSYFQLWKVEPKVLSVSIGKMKMKWIFYIISPRFLYFHLFSTGGRSRLLIELLLDYDFDLCSSLYIWMFRQSALYPALNGQVWSCKICRRVVGSKHKAISKYAANGSKVLNFAGKGSKIRQK